MENQFEISSKFPVSATKLYADWLNSEAHSKFTGSKANIKPALDSKFNCWDGYINGEILELEEGKRILHTWRTTEFNSNAKDSMVEVIFEPINDSTTKLIIKHWDIPEGDSEKYLEGWKEYYFKPMKAYYAV